MTETHRITPGRVPRTGALFGIIISALFLIFGGFICYQAIQNISSGEMSLGIVLSLFSLIWMVGCIAILINFTRIYKACDPSPDNQFVRIERLHTSEDPEMNQDFDTRLRKLESLYQDSLITEAEYNAKRSEVLEEKW